MDLVESLTPQVFALPLLAAWALILVVLRRRRPKSWHFALWFLSFVAVFLALAVGRYFLLASRLGPFEAHLGEYTAVSEYQPGDPYVRGKLFPVDLQEGTIDFVLYQELPRELRAASPEEVGTVVDLQCAASLVGTYTRGGGAYRWTCKLKLIDLSISKIVGETVFTGSEPPPTKASLEGDQYGSKPLPEAIAYVTSLPRR